MRHGKFQRLEPAEGIEILERIGENMARIWIEEAECSVPRRGTQHERRKLHQELLQTHPAFAADLHSQPWYTNPDGKFGGDDMTIFDWTFVGEDQLLRGWRSYVPVDKLYLLKGVTLGEPRQHSIEEGGCAEYSFTVKASYALAVLKSAEIIPKDSVLGNDDEKPLSCDEDLE
jgi:hypothetical protein